MKKIFLLAVAASAFSLNAQAADVCKTFIKDVNSFVSTVNSTKSADATAKRSATFDLIKTKNEVQAMEPSAARVSKCTTGSTQLLNTKANWKTKYTALDKVTNKTDAISNKISNKLKF